MKLAWGHVPEHTLLDPSQPGRCGESWREGALRVTPLRPTLCLCSQYSAVIYAGLKKPCVTDEDYEDTL